MIPGAYLGDSAREWRSPIGMVSRERERHVVFQFGDRHPDIDIRWKKVTLHFVTHDAGPSITELDTRQAAECDLLFAAAP